MRIKNHRVEGLPFTAAYYTGGQITPTIVVLHDTAGRLTKGNSAAYLASKNTAKASVHFVVEIDGSVSQHIATNRRANHAGASSFNGRHGCNDFSIGIEIVNPGRMTRLSDTQAQAWWGEQFAVNLTGIQEVETPQHGRGFWMAYPEPQLRAVIDLLTCLFRDVPTLTDITTHWYVSPGRKVDVNPLFPLDQVRAAVLGHDDPGAVAAEQGSIPFDDGEAMVRIEVPDDSLNLRRWPSFNPNIIATIPNGAVVPVLRAGLFAGRQWLCVLYGGREGWVVASYAKPVTTNPTGFK